VLHVVEPYNLELFFSVAAGLFDMENVSSGAPRKTPLLKKSSNCYASSTVVEPREGKLFEPLALLGLRNRLAVETWPTVPQRGESLTR
jgi:hypothetical protein